MIKNTGFREMRLAEIAVKYYVVSAVLGVSCHKKGVDYTFFEPINRLLAMGYCSYGLL
jgi:hypothetical protein